MYKIYIDTTERYNKIVRIVEINTRDSKVTEENSPNEKLIAQEKGDIDIIATIKSLLAKNNIHFKDIIEVIPNTGPGSFTGLKMGITDANIMNWALSMITDTKDMSQKTYTPNYGAEPNISTPKN